MINGELIVDNFAGGGGASTGIELATGVSVDIAINHDPKAIAMHKANHPDTTHYCESVWDVDPVKACSGHPVALAWFSPDCKHFSKAKGGKPKDKNIRGLAWVALRWAGLVRPRIIMLENVEEFQTWGPLNRSHRPIKKKAGATYRKFIKQLEELGYEVDTRILSAADYGTPTIRKRFFLIARCDGQPIVWPKATHAPADSLEVISGQRLPYVGRYTQIDFSLPCPSIFETKEEIFEKYGLRVQRPLKPKTMQRIARGLKKFVIDNNEPFIVQVNHSGNKSDYCHSMNKPLGTVTAKHGFGIVEPVIAPYIEVNRSDRPGNSVEEPLCTITGINQHCVAEVQMVVAPTLIQCKFDNGAQDVEKPLGTVTTVGSHMIAAANLIQYHSETAKDEVRGQDINDPIMTVDGSNRYGLVTSFLSKFYKTGTGQDIREPLHTVTTSQGHFGEVRAFLIKYYGGEGRGQDIRKPLDTITTKDRFGLVTIKGVDYKIVDIGLRMLEPRELYNCQGFPPDYIIDNDHEGNVYPRKEQVARCGNAVCPPIPAALVRTNAPELCEERSKQ